MPQLCNPCPEKIVHQSEGGKGQCSIKGFSALPEDEYVVYVLYRSELSAEVVQIHRACSVESALKCISHVSAITTTTWAYKLFIFSRSSLPFELLGLTYTSTERFVCFSCIRSKDD